MTDKTTYTLREMARKLAQRSIVTEATARLIEQVLTEAHEYHKERFDKLEAALVFYARGGNVAATIDDAARGDIDLSRASEVLTDDCGEVARKALAVLKT